MAEELNNVEKTEPEQVDTQEQGQQQSTEKMVTVAEMTRRINKVKSQNEEAISVAVKEAIEKYKAESELTGKELDEYRKKEAEKEKQTLLEKINMLEQEQVKRELTDEAIKSLSSRKLPVNEKVLAFVVRDNADDTLKAIEDFSSIIADIKAEFTKSKAPNVSSSFGESTSTSRTEIFRNSRIIK
uniref:Major head protein n=1 Tax=Siphoviridae sp. ct8eQ1 TaxID=2826171 RepID=A0A8S5N0T8_9CAUD|nr:MAG TPA: Major head protein [Siphoviridae sp. ct8eQ1]